jgi:hypothetical protein
MGAHDALESLKQAVGSFSQRWGNSTTAIIAESQRLTAPLAAAAWKQATASTADASSSSSSARSSSSSSISSGGDAWLSPALSMHCWLRYRAPSGALPLPSSAHSAPSEPRSSGK